MLKRLRRSLGLTRMPATDWMLILILIVKVVERKESSRLIVDIDCESKTGFEKKKKDRDWMMILIVNCKACFEKRRND